MPPALACLLLMLLALPPAAPSCPMLCTCYSSPPTVSCQANNFSSVPLSLPPSTQRLFLQNNLIRTLRPGTFGPNLLTLWLFSNNLSTIYPGTFRHLQALEELDLGDNRHLRSLEPDTFQGLERLQSLHLYRCQLSSLPGNIFRGLVSLQYLYLQENSLLHLQWPNLDSILKIWVNFKDYTEVMSEHHARGRKPDGRGREHAGAQEGGGCGCGLGVNALPQPEASDQALGGRPGENSSPGSEGGRTTVRKQPPSSGVSWPEQSGCSCSENWTSGNLLTTVMPCTTGDDLKAGRSGD
ncbi:hypothetical protein P7K49_021785 [Saguinus oedipus]|uniref:Uncharacterized protein n=1 Tax=Saguinus oedipus TaxID=9490 RepID=A0ABQ9UTQ9_SAGOE|nr:hypothetical protein P7K49_021785 [Saguinus oedipus]